MDAVPARAASCRRRPPRRQAAAGVTLLEMLLVIVLVAAMAGLAAAALHGGLDGTRLRTAARQVGAELRFARVRALASGQVQRFELDLGDGRWRGANGHRGRLPEGMRLRFTGARQVQPREGSGSIVFFPDGASSGGRIELALRQASWRVDVTWMTGEVRVAPVAAP